jgi:hypothetical protein
VLGGQTVFESSGWQGEFLFTKVSSHSREVETIQVKNRLTDGGLNLMRNALIGADSDIQIKFLAFGTSAAPIQDDQTELVDERFRKAFTLQEQTTVGAARSIVSLLDTEAQFWIREVGVFAGANASSIPNSGVLLSRILLNFDKSNTNDLYSLRVERIDTIRRG